ncbi:hypothetical protein DL95DRAFT_462351 [Leptodontidium sp. 2 PMI_412]|nr:hypothetical protein DL95DRAFT_462351 [Leptodontidium sp. 2 PMI_412]
MTLRTTPFWWPARATAPPTCTKTSTRYFVCGCVELSSTIHSETCVHTQVNTTQDGSRALVQTEGCESPKIAWAINDGPCGVCRIYDLLGRDIHPQNFDWKINFTAAHKSAIKEQYQHQIAIQQEAARAEAAKQRRSTIQKAWEEHVAYLNNRDMLEVQHNLSVLEDDLVYTLKVRRESEGEILIVSHIESLEEFKKFERDFAFPERSFASLRFLKLDPPPVVKPLAAPFPYMPKNMACYSFPVAELSCTE